MTGSEPGFRRVEIAGLSALVHDGPADAASRPTLVWTHATGFHAATYLPLLGRLATLTRVVAADLRGHGHTRLDAVPADLDGWGVFRDDLHGLLGTLDGPALLAGHSLGSILSLMVAGLSPERVTGVLMVEPVLPPPFVGWGLGAARRVGLGHKVPIVAGAARRRRVWPSREAALAAWKGRGAFRTWPEEWLRAYVDGGLRDRPDGQVELVCDPAWEARTFEVTSYTTWPLLRAVSVPTLILHAHRSYTFPPLSARLARRASPLVTVETRPDASHFLPMEEPEVVEAALRRMLIPA